MSSKKDNCVPASFAVPASLLDRVHRVAERQGISASELLRRSLEVGLNTPGELSELRQLRTQVRDLQKLFLGLNDVQRDYAKCFTSLDKLLHLVQRSLLELAKEIAAIKAAIKKGTD